MKQYVNMCWFVWIFSGYNLNVLWIANNSARKHVCSLGSLLDICMSSLVELYIPYPVFFFFHCPFVF